MAMKMESNKEIAYGMKLFRFGSRRNTSSQLLIRIDCEDCSFILPT